MLEANKKLWFEKVFAVYNRNLLKRRFHSLQVKNFNQLQERNKNIPLIIYTNHSSWWDGLVLFEILKGKDFDSFVMMEEKQLKDLGFFRYLGAFSVIRENFREAVKSADYAVGTLKTGNNKTLLIFPQGEILASDYRPVKFFNGLAYIVEKIGKCNLLPCSVRYEFLKFYKPQIFVRFGEMEFVEIDKDLYRKKFTADIEKTMTENLDSLKFDIIDAKLDDYINIL